MLFAPADKPFDYRKPPRLSLGLAALLLALAFWLFPSDEERSGALDRQYRAELLAVEWPLYPQHLMQHGQARRIPALETARQSGQDEVLVRQLGYDRGFAEGLRSSGADYLDPETLARWQQSRDAFDSERNRLSSQVLGLDPQRFRPITFLSHAFTDSNLYAVLLSVLILLLVGMPAEWAAGSGALLTAWLAGSLAGSFGWLVLHWNSVQPLTGSAHGLSGVIGLAAWQFRQRGSLRILESAFTLGLVIPAAMALLLAGLQVYWQGGDWRIAISLFLALAAGTAVALAHDRWYRHDDTEEALPQFEETPISETYRQDLNQVMQKISQMQFVAAEKNIRALLERYPGDKRLLEQLYHLVKLNPGGLEFEEIAFSLLTLPNQPASNNVSLRIYRDYIKRSPTFVALDDNTSLQLVLRFTRIDALKEAEELFKNVLESKRQAPLLAKAAVALAQACAARGIEQRASYYAGLARSA